MLETILSVLNGVAAVITIAVFAHTCGKRLAARHKSRKENDRR